MLKQLHARAPTVDGTRSVADVIELMLCEGMHAVALKYIHKFGLRDAFPPDQLVSRCLLGEGELTVQTCGLLLKYVPLLGLDGRHPKEALIERISACGVTVHDLGGGKFVCKGRRRLTNSHQTSSPSMSASASPQPGTLCRARVGRCPSHSDF